MKQKDLLVTVEQSILDSKEDYLQRQWDAWEDTYRFRVTVEVSRYTEDDDEWS